MGKLTLARVDRSFFRGKPVLSPSIDCLMFRTKCFRNSVYENVLLFLRSYFVSSLLMSSFDRPKLCFSTMSENPENERLSVIRYLFTHVQQTIQSSIMLLV